MQPGMLADSKAYQKLFDEFSTEDMQQWRAYAIESADLPLREILGLLFPSQGKESDV